MTSLSTVGDVAGATGGQIRGCDPGQQIASVTIDSRNVAPGALFVALRGDRYDGHDYVEDAIAAGAVAALVSRPAYSSTGGELASVVVADTEIALGSIAAHVLRARRGQGRPDVIAITGSVGKTGTKDMLGQVLARVGLTVVPAGSHNNEVGLPMTVLRADPDAQYLVLEMGARHRGNIAYLCRIAAPRVGIVLRVGHSHIGEFGSLQSIVDTKAELVESLPSGGDGGVAILNYDDPLVAAMANRTNATVVSFGRTPGAMIHASDITFDDHVRARFTLNLDEFSAPVHLRSLGDPAIDHALAAAAAARAAGMAPVDIAAALGDAEARSAGRLTLLRSPAGIDVLDDSYNASPESMAAALRTLVGLSSERTWAVLGLMHELGADSVRLHSEVGRLAAGLGVDRVVVVGARAAPIATAANEVRAGAAVVVADQAEAIDVLRSETRRGDTVLVKGSRAEGLDNVVTALRETTGGRPCD